MNKIKTWWERVDYHNLESSRSCETKAMQAEIADLRAAYDSLLRERDEWKARAENMKRTDIADRLREYAGNPGYSHNDYADMMRAGADEIDRYYTGMLAWKQTAETKDRKLSEEITARINERVEARLKEQAEPDLSSLQQYGCGESDPEFRPMENGGWVHIDAVAALLAAGKAGALSKEEIADRHEGVAQATEMAVNMQKYGTIDVPKKGTP